MKKEPPKSLIRQTKELGIPMPPCDTCKDNKYVRYLGVDWMGCELRCTKCRQQWVTQL
jgi:hypothetical protein